MRLSRFNNFDFSSPNADMTLDLILGRGISHLRRKCEPFRPVLARPLASARSMQPLRDHMNPRSTSQPSESDSRHLLPAVTASLGWIAARVVLVTAMPIARMRQG